VRQRRNDAWVSAVNNSTATAADQIDRDSMTERIKGVASTGASRCNYVIMYNDMPATR